MEAHFPVVYKLKSKEKSSPNPPPVMTQKDPVSGRVGQTVTKFIQTPQISQLQDFETRLSSSEITAGLLKTLSDVSNPICHSNIAERSDCIVSFATGHQVSEGRRNRQAYTTQQASKLRVQQEADKSSSQTQTGILHNTRVYIGGYLESTTDIEMKRLVVQAGGQIVSSASNCTHIVTSRCLSASKSDRILTKKSRTNVYVVKPEWVLDSIAIGKRRSERTYAIVKSSNTLKAFLES